MEGCEEVFEQLVVAVRRFHEDLGLVTLLHFLLQLAQRLQPVAFLDGQVTVETELLTAKATGHQAKKYS